MKYITVKLTEDQAQHLKGLIVVSGDNYNSKAFNTRLWKKLQAELVKL